MADEKNDRLPAEVRAQMLQKETSLYFNMAKFEHAQRIAALFASSTMVPKHFQNNTANCLIALNYADRLQADPFMVMQNMYIVHGRPGIEAKLIIALINQSGKYSEPLKFKFDGEGDDYGCTAWTREAKSGEMVEGPKVTWKMAKAERWNVDKKNNETGYVQPSKWNTMPEMMYRYRAASYFANIHCPELKLGMQTVEEINDFVELQENKNGKWEPPAAPAEEEPPAWLPAFAGLVEAPEFGLFVAATKQANRSTEAELRKAANGNPEGFIAAYRSWLAKHQKENPKDENAQDQQEQKVPVSDQQPVQPKTEPAQIPAPPQTQDPGAPVDEDQENPFHNRDAWKNFRTKSDGLSSYYFRNRKAWPAASDAAKLEFAEKWRKCYPDTPFPGVLPQAGPVTPPASPPTEEASRREDMILSIREIFDLNTIREAKKLLGFIEGDNAWPPTAEGLRVLSAKCEELSR